MWSPSGAIWRDWPGKACCADDEETLKGAVITDKWRDERPDLERDGKALSVGKTDSASTALSGRKWKALPITNDLGAVEYATDGIGLLLPTSLCSGQAGNIYMTVPTGTGSAETFDTTDEIAFGFNEETTYGGYTAYDVRLQHSDAGSSLISNVPVRLTVVDYSSDVRIKRKITDANTDELLQRLQQVEYKRYRYTEAWQDVRGIEDVEVRGVIAQQLHEVTLP